MGNIFKALAVATHWIRIAFHRDLGEALQSLPGFGSKIVSLLRLLYPNA